MSTSEREPTLLEQGWSLFFASTSAASREPAMRIAIRLVESDPFQLADRKSTRLNSSHNPASRMPSSA
jgi:hypothetical protein